MNFHKTITSKCSRVMRQRICKSIRSSYVMKSIKKKAERNKFIGNPIPPGVCTNAELKVSDDSLYSKHVKPQA